MFYSIENRKTGFIIHLSVNADNEKQNMIILRKFYSVDNFEIQKIK